ncbi:MAG: outer membrane protein assembly factor BamB, partial [Candidatus Paceibacteria bacterium]
MKIVMKCWVWTASLAFLAAYNSPQDAFNAGAAQSQMAASELRGWLSWRGPDQNGTSPETDLIDSLTLEGENHLWSYELSGRGTPVVANGRVFALGYEGTGPELQELLVCLDEATGERLWEHRNSDFLSDVIYSRYAIGSPTIDPATGNVFAMTGAGLLHAFTAEGAMLWELSLMETLGRLSFPNGRIGAPLVVGDLVIVHCIFAGWGKVMGPARDRFFAFDKHSGDVVWGSTPGGPPKDSSFSFPVVEERNGRTVFYAGLGGGHVVCVDALTGTPQWRFPLAVGGVNSSALLHGENLIVIHGKENLDSSTIGRMISLKLGATPAEDGVLAPVAEEWRNELVAFTSSPVLVGDTVYQTTQTGELVALDANTGHELWHEKLAPDQLHASPLAADGKLYVPMNNGTFFIVRPSPEGLEVLDKDQLAGSCLGAPAIAGGRIFVHTTERLYCFGRPSDGAPSWPDPAQNEIGDPTQLQLVPADVTYRAGDLAPFRVRRLDAAGRLIDELASADVTIETPPFVGANGTGVGTVKASFGDLSGVARVRAVPTLPWADDFEGYKLDMGKPASWSFPPAHWLGAKIKWRVIEKDGQHVVARHMANPLFQRTMSLIGHPDDSNYTAQADVMTEGNRRSMSSIGLVNQRYLVVLKGNHQAIEVSSNMERLKV